MNISEAIMAVLFAYAEPIELSKLANAINIHLDDCVVEIDSLIAKLDEEQAGLQILKFKTRYQLTTRAIYSDIIKLAMEQKRTNSLSQPALEVLAIIAYNQPVTKSFIEQVRGVDCNATVNSLVEKGLCEEAGRLELPGRPIAYRVTDNFLRTFGISSLDELPELRLVKQTNSQSEQLSIL